MGGICFITWSDLGVYFHPGTVLIGFVSRVVAILKIYKLIYKCKYECLETVGLACPYCCVSVACN